MCPSQPALLFADWREWTTNRTDFQWQQIFVTRKIMQNYHRRTIYSNTKDTKIGSPCIGSPRLCIMFLQQFLSSLSRRNTVYMCNSFPIKLVKKIIQVGKTWGSFFMKVYAISLQAITYVQSYNRVFRSHFYGPPQWPYSCTGTVTTEHSEAVFRCHRVCAKAVFVPILYMR